MCIAPHVYRSWSNALLRFIVYDETPHKIPGAFHQPFALATGQLGSPESSNVERGSAVTTPKPPLSLFHIPSAPILYPNAPVVGMVPTFSGSSIPAAPQVDQAQLSSMDVDPLAPHTDTSRETKPCCQSTNSKHEIQVLLNDFQNDLGRLLVNTFGAGQSSAQNDGVSLRTTDGGSSFSAGIHSRPLPNPPSGASTPTNKSNDHISIPGDQTPRTPMAIHRGVYCDQCQVTILGIRHKCMDCPGWFSYFYLLLFLPMGSSTSRL